MRFRNRHESRLHVRYTCEKSRDEECDMRSTIITRIDRRREIWIMRIMCFARITSFELSLLNPPLRLFKINRQSLAGYGWRKKRGRRERGRDFMYPGDLIYFFSRDNSFCAAISLVRSPFGARPRDISPRGTLGLLPFRALSFRP